jgi:hypothetical protein
VDAATVTVFNNCHYSAVKGVSQKFDFLMHHDSACRDSSAISILSYSHNTDTKLILYIRL